MFSFFLAMNSGVTPMVGNLRINGDRLWSSIMETARLGATPNGGLPSDPDERGRRSSPLV
jgi:beta-ureidopropionase / N-carbamoyl-L-amino-acid hydrolase